MHRPLRDVLRAGFVEPTRGNATNSADSDPTIDIPLVVPREAGDNLFRSQNGVKPEKIGFHMKRDGSGDYALSVPVSHKTLALQNVILDAEADSPREFTPPTMKSFHKWIDTMRTFLVKEMESRNGRNGYAEGYDRLSLCKITELVYYHEGMVYRITEPMPMLLRGTSGEWDLWTERFGLDNDAFALHHDNIMDAWFKVWNALLPNEAINYVFVLDKQ